MSEKPISLSDEQMNALFAAAQPLLPRDRSTFLASVAARFSGRTEVGDGELGRAIRELQHDYFKAPSGIGIALKRSNPRHDDKINRRTAASEG